MVHRRLLALVSVGAVVGALATGVTQASSSTSSLPTNGLTFASTATTADILAHYTVTPSGRGVASAAATSNEDGLVTKWPKGNGPASVSSSGGANGNNAGSAPTNPATPAAAASFIGMQSSATICNYFGHGCNPPDMALAASPSWVFQGVNTSWEVLDTSGNVQPGWPVNAQQFFGVPNEPNNCDPTHFNQAFISDPRALYDPADGRFWAAELQIEGSVAFGIAPTCPYKSVYFVAVSQTNNPNGNWNVYVFNMEKDLPNPDKTIQKFGADYTQLGINSQAVYFSANMFGENGGFFAELFEANKAQMEAGKAHFTADGFMNMRIIGPATPASNPFIADTVQPTLNLDSSNGTTETFLDTLDFPDPVTGHSCGFFGGGFDQSCSGLARWDMANPIAHDTGGVAPTLNGSYVATAPFLVSVPADQPSCNLCIDVLDLRLTATPVIRNGVAYGAWETAINNGNNSSHPVPGIEWAEVSLNDNISNTNYFNFSGSEAASFGTLMPDASGNVTMLFEHMGHKVFPETRYITKGASDPNFVGPGNLLKAGESSYRPTLCGGKIIPVCRWGDYEAASFDGSGHIWFAGEYANMFISVTAPPAFGRNWGTWIGAIAAS
jgi:hypothetical protein